MTQPARLAASGNRVSAQTLSEFEGFVLTTTRMFARQVQREEDDLAQELRVRVWRAIEQFDTSRSTWIGRGYEAALKGYVYCAVTNKIKDYKRDAAREKERLERNGLEFRYIEDTRRFKRHDALGTDGSAEERFDSLYNFVSQEQVYGEIESEPFMAHIVDLTVRERAVGAMLALGYDRDECADELGCNRAAVNETVSSLRGKIAT